MFESCSTYGKHLTSRCLTYVKHVFRSCWSYVKHVFRSCSSYVKHMLANCETYIKPACVIVDCRLMSVRYMSFHSVTMCWYFGWLGVCDWHMFDICLTCVSVMFYICLTTQKQHLTISNTTRHSAHQRTHTHICSSLNSTTQTTLLHQSCMVGTTTILYALLCLLLFSIR